MGKWVTLGLIAFKILIFSSQSYHKKFKSVGKVGFCFYKTPTQQCFTSGTINGSRVSTIVRDTGCTCVLVSEEVLPDVDVSSCRKIPVVDYLGCVDHFPLVRCYMHFPYYDGWVNAVRAPIKLCSVLIDNVEGARPLDDPSSVISSSVVEQVQSVQTRAATVRKIYPLALPNLEPLSITPEDFSRLSFSCTSLSTVRNKAVTGEEEITRNGSSFIYELHNGLYYSLSLFILQKHLE